MKNNLLCTSLLLAAAFLLPACRTQKETPRLIASEMTETGDDEEIHRRFKPLERPQVRFSLVRAAHVGDSCWIAVKIAIPNRSIQKKECFNADIVLHTPDGFMELNSIQLYDEKIGDSPLVPRSEDDIQIDAFPLKAKHIRQLFYSSKFAYDPRMERFCSIKVLPSIRSEKYEYIYQPLTLPVYWDTDTSIWKAAKLLPSELLTGNALF